MILLQVQQIHKSFGATTILDQIDLTVSDKDRIGLVGRNGAGKTTLIKIITGEMLPDSGTVTLAKQKTLGYLSQDAGLNSENLIWEEMLSVFQHLILLEQELRELEQKMGQEEILSNAQAYEKLMEDYARKSEAFQSIGGFSYQAQIRSLLTGLGFPEPMWHEPISSLSGGQKTRLAMVKLLLTSPDLLVLDEPTNYLDIETLSWLESYLTNYPGAILVVSHDRYFLDRIVNNIYEIEANRGFRFPGNYTYYQQKKAEIIEAQLKSYQQQQDEIKRLNDFVQRNLARASTTKRAQSRRKTLEKMEKIVKPTFESKLSPFSFEIDRMTGNDVLTVRNLTIGYQDKALASKLNFTIERRERVAIIGPNGVGKTTLLKTLIKHLPPLAGQFQWGSQVKIGYYDQEQTGLDEGKRVLDVIWDAYPLMPELEVRSHLGRFLFSGEEVEKQVSDLSGGEKARLSLAKLMLTKANVLILDEPTNHLDLFSKEILEQALLDYPGTLLFISHDRYFLNRISTKTLELSGHGITTYLGNYDYFLDKKAEMSENEKNSNSTQVGKEQEKARVYRQELRQEVEGAKLGSFEQMKELRNQIRQLERRIQELEELIDRHEKEVLQLEEESCKPEVLQDHEQLLTIQNRVNKLQTEIEACLFEWEEATIELQQLQTDQP